MAKQPMDVGPTATEMEVINNLLEEKYGTKAIEIQCLYDPMYSKETYLATLENGAVIQLALELKVYRVKNAPKQEQPNHE